MASLHQAAKNGQLDECRRLVEKEGKNVNEKDNVSVCLVVCLIVNHKLHWRPFQKHSGTRSFNAFDREH
jgi:hypothetical protein